MFKRLNSMTAFSNKDPLHGMTLEAIVNALVAHFGWAELGARIDIRCFTHEPSLASSLKFLRKTPWARAKVDSLYAFMLRDLARAQRMNQSIRQADPPS